MSLTITILLATSSIIGLLWLLISRNKIAIRNYLHKKSFGLTMHTLRPAIHAADADKEATDKKNIVILNTLTNEFEPVQKVVLKRIAAKNRNTNNAAQTKYRKRNQSGGARKFDPSRISKIEKASVYVTK